MERFSFIFLVAGLGLFGLAFGVSAYLPMLPVQDLKVRTVEQLAANVPVDFIELKEQYPRAYRQAFYSKGDEKALTELQAQQPAVFEKVFKKTAEQSLTSFLKADPASFKKVFGADAELEDAMDALDGEPEEIGGKLKAANAAAYANAFELSVASAMAELDSEYELTLLKIQRADPQAYKAIFEERTDSDVLAEALRLGHRTYIAEACWHCHSQQVRPWGRDEARYGQVSYPEEYHNELNYPPLWGTRRIGPDLIRRGGKRSNDWHVAHFIHPPDVSPNSVMPSFTWFYEADGKTPNKTGLSIIAYVQWLGSWQHSREETVYQAGDIERSFPAPEGPVQAVKEEAP